ncbi:hypothetical protein E3N88_46343 [Mikania micrantha]|uniref:Post-GPI attachment to proteins factor 3 n=1 Tax=Mikania micrantha TaxID=192012 RepID=A0A5N6L6V2_9ASTR|nr:hypothetical protein E3N88_46343 [Mikania micrantha]
MALSRRLSVVLVAVFGLLPVLAPVMAMADPIYIILLGPYRYPIKQENRPIAVCAEQISMYAFMEEEREKAGDTPVKYHGKWPLKRAFGIEEPAAVAFSALNLAVQFHGWVSFFILVNYKLPLRPTRQTY